VPQAATAAPVATTAETLEGVRVVEVVPREGTTNGRKWTRYTVIDSNGVEYSTFSASLAKAATEAKAAGALVELAAETDGQYQTLVEIVRVGPGRSSADGAL
jgi:hypothetical protein